MFIGPIPEGAEGGFRDRDMNVVPGKEIDFKFEGDPNLGIAIPANRTGHLFQVNFVMDWLDAPKQREPGCMVTWEEYTSRPYRNWMKANTWTDIIRGSYANGDRGIAGGLPINAIAKGLMQRGGGPPRELGGNHDEFNTADAPTISTGGGQRTIFGRITLSAGCESCKASPVVAYWAQDVSSGGSDDHSWLYTKDSSEGGPMITGIGSDASKAAFGESVARAPW
jgi:hypothetical protein